MHATLGVQTSENPQQSDSPGQAEPSRDLELVVRLLEALNTGNDRSDAAERFVQLISFMLPDRQVVFALGRRIVSFRRSSSKSFQMRLFRKSSAPTSPVSSSS